MTWKVSIYPCPICGANQECQGDSDDYSERCPNGCCLFSHSYGNYDENIGEKEWQWHYTESNEEMDKRHKERRDQIEEMKRQRAKK